MKILEVILLLLPSYIVASSRYFDSTRIYFCLALEYREALGGR